MSNQRRCIKIISEYKFSIDFLNNLSSSSLGSITDYTSIYSVILKNNGRFDFDFFVTKVDQLLIIDFDECFCESVDSFFKKYRLKNAKFDIINPQNESFFQKFYIIDKEENRQNTADILAKISAQHQQTYTQTSFASEDNRFAIHDKVALRALSCDEDSMKSIHREIEKYFPKIQPIHNIDDFFIENKIVDGSWLVPDKSILLEYGFDKLCNGRVIDFNKGCYLGQELMTRIKRSGVVRKMVKKIPNQEISLHKNAEIIKTGSKETLVLLGI